MADDGKPKIERLTTGVPTLDAILHGGFPVGSLNIIAGGPGTGKSTLVRAIAGLWPWGGGEILIKFDGLYLMPQEPYLPLGTLRRAATYPLSPEAVDDAGLEQQRLVQRRLARACRAADRDDLPWVDGEVDASQHLAARAVAKVDVAKLDAERPGRNVERVAALGQRANALQPCEAAARRCGRPLTQVDDPAERLERPDELQQQRDEEHELADREPPLDHLAAAEPEHGGDPERGEEEEAGQVVRLDRRLPHRLVPHGLGAAEEARAHVVLAAEGLHHLDPDDGLVGRLGQIALAHLDEPGDREELRR